MNRREAIVTASKSLAGISALSLVEESCGTGETFSFLAALFSAVNGAVGELAPILSTIGLTSALLASVQNALTTATDFVTQAGAIVMDKTKSTLQIIEGVLALAPGVLAALNIPGLSKYSALAGIALAAIVAAVNAIVGVLTAMKMSASAAWKPMGVKGQTYNPGVSEGKLNLSALDTAKVRSVVSEAAKVRAMVLREFAK